MHGVKPGNIVGAIANEGGLDAAGIGRVMIRDDFSLVDLPQDLDEEVLQHLSGVRVAGQALRIRLDRGPGRRPERAGREDGFERPKRAARTGKPSARGPAEGPTAEHSPVRKGSGKSAAVKTARPSKARPARAQTGTSDAEEKRQRGRPPVTRAQRKAGHGSRGKFRK